MFISFYHSKYFTHNRVMKICIEYRICLLNENYMSEKQKALHPGALTVSRPKLNGCGCSCFRGASHESQQG